LQVIYQQNKTAYIQCDRS